MICKNANDASAFLQPDAVRQACIFARMEDERERVAAIFRQCVAESGLTPSALARSAGLSPSTITRFLAGKVGSIPSTRTVAKVVKAARAAGAAAHDGPQDAAEQLLLMAWGQLDKEGRDSLLEMLDAQLSGRKNKAV